MSASGQPGSLEPQRQASLQHGRGAAGVSTPPDDEFEVLDAEPTRVWTASEFQALVHGQPRISVLALLGQQLALGLLISALAALSFGRDWGLSLALGCVVVLGPALVCGWGVSRKRATHAHAALIALIAWQLVKWVLSAVLLLVVCITVPDLKMWGLLLGMVLGLKSGWLLLALRRQRLVL